MASASVAASVAAIDLARKALLELAQAAPAATIARDALGALDELDLAPPFTIAFVGEPATLVRLLDELAGEPLFAGSQLDGDVLVTMRRGARTVLRAHRRDGTVDDLPASSPPATPSPTPFEAESTELVRRLPWWAVLRRLVSWIQAWRAKRRPRLVAPEVSKLALAPVGVARGLFADALRRACSDPNVDRLTVEVGRGQLTDDVVIVAVSGNAAGTARADRRIGADLVLVADAERGMPAPNRLSEIAGIERSLGVLHPARDALSAGGAAIDASVAETELGFRDRLLRLETARIADADAHVAEALARLRPGLVEHGHRILRQIQARLEAEIEQFDVTWSVRLLEAKSADMLRSAAAAIDEVSPTAMQAARAAAQQLLVDELGAHARATCMGLINELRDGTGRADPLPAWLTIDIALRETSSGTDLGSVAPRLTSLFRSIETLKTSALHELTEQIKNLLQVAVVNLLEVEPKLEPAVTGTIATALRAEVVQHAAWIEAELAQARIEIEAERAQIAPLVRAGGIARGNARQLDDLLANLQARLS